MAVLTLLLGRLALVSAGMVVAVSAAAELTLNVDLGYSMPEASGYQSSLYGSAAFGFQSGQWLGEAGFTRLGEFEVENGSDDTHITSEGPFLMVSRIVEGQWLDWEFGLGAARLESAAVLQGYELQSESNWEPLVEAAISKNLSRTWTLKGGYIYCHDVMGTNVSAVALGARRSF